MSITCVSLNKLPVNDENEEHSQIGTPSGSQRSVSNRKLVVNNESITTSKLREELAVNYGVYLSLLDEIDWLFDALDGRNRVDGIDRRMWLSLSSKSRNTTRNNSVIDQTRLNYTGRIHYNFAGLHCDGFYFTPINNLITKITILKKVTLAKQNIICEPHQTRVS